MRVHPSHTTGPPRTVLEKLYFRNAVHLIPKLHAL